VVGGQASGDREVLYVALNLEHAVLIEPVSEGNNSDGESATSAHPLCYPPTLWMTLVNDGQDVESSAEVAPSAAPAPAAPALPRPLAACSTVSRRRWSVYHQRGFIETWVFLSYLRLLTSVFDKVEPCQTQPSICAALVPHQSWRGPKLFVLPSARD
jgi:hypothetical protein